MTLAQVELINQGGMLYRYNSLRKACQPSLVELSKNKSIEGARAAAILTVNFPLAATPDDEYSNQLLWVNAYRRLVNHPSIGELMLSDDRLLSSTVFSRLQFLDPKVVGESGLIQEIMPLLEMPMSTGCGTSCFVLFKVADDKETGLSEDLVQEVRIKVLQKTEETLSLYQSENAPQKNIVENLESLVAYLSGSSAKGELIGYPAPEIHFDYGSPYGVNLLSDLKGKVVVIDFWATWCSPCIGSFPNLRALEVRYKDYPVVILGVTSLQGSHTDQVNKQRINTSGNPDLEYSLMEQFINDMDITWEIVFSRESQFNPDFGVRGIPHVAIVDPEGIVRYNQLRPYNPPWHEAEKIDDMLRKAGLPYPSEPMEKINYSNVEE
jgi:thiol-disulfide isomerase/thioredoxin